MIEDRGREWIRLYQLEKSVAEFEMNMISL